MHDWPLERIEAEIWALLEEGHSFVCEPTSEGWVVRVEDSAEAVIWEGGHIDHRLALFEAYGYLRWQKHTPTGAWASARPRPTIAEVVQRASEQIGDPEDLDPAEVALVYGRGNKGD